jgi:hypothetical protein
MNQFIGGPTEFVQVVPEIVLPAHVPQPIRGPAPIINYAGPQQTIWQTP